MIFLFWNFLIILINHLIWSSIDFKMLKIEPWNQLFSCQLKSLFSDFDKLLIMLNDFFDMNFKFRIHFFMVDIGFIWHLLDHTDDFTKHVRSCFLYKSHQIFNFFLFRLIDNHFVTFIHKKVELISKFAVIKKSVVNFYKTVILIFSLLVLS